MVQLSQLYMTRGKPIVLTIQTFVGKVMSYLNGLVAFSTFFKSEFYNQELKI